MESLREGVKAPQDTFQDTFARAQSGARAHSHARSIARARTHTHTHTCSHMHNSTHTLTHTHTYNTHTHTHTGARKADSILARSQNLERRTEYRTHLYGGTGMLSSYLCPPLSVAPYACLSFLPVGLSVCLCVCPPLSHVHVARMSRYRKISLSCSMATLM